MAKKTNKKKYPKAKAGYFLQVDPKELTYEALPCPGCKDHLMAAAGMYMDPGPRMPMPNLANSIAQMQYANTGPFPSIPQMNSSPQGAVSTNMLPAIDTTKATAQPLNPNKLKPPKPKKGGGFNSGNVALAAMTAVDALLPNPVSKHQVVQPQMAYNPNPYGLGSQALMEYGGYIMGEDENNSPSAKNGKQMKSKKKSKKYDDGGAVPALFNLMDTFYGELGNAADSLGSAFGGNLPIPMGKDGHWIQKAVNPAHKGYCTPMTKSTCTPRRKALAKTFKKHHGFHKKEDGGIIPDNMSNFSPHEYEQGGNVNGGAKVREVGANYPNTNLLEQWLLYANGGNVNGGADIREVGPNYPNSDLMEQWLLYEAGGSVNGDARIREVGANYPNSDLMEQWLLYKNGGTLSADKAKEMLRDGTANGKKLTKKQKQYFGMVASGKLPTGGKVKGDPGKPLASNRPTSQDSLNLYNNSLKVLDYYKNRGYKGGESGTPIGAIANLDLYAKEYDPSLPRAVPLTNGKSKEVKLPMSQYRKDVDQNQFYQREGMDSMLDTRSPMQLFDRRIEPTKRYRFENTDTTDPLYGDIVGIYSYDPEKIKPSFLRNNPTRTSSPNNPKPVIPAGPELNPTAIQGIVPTGRPNVQASPYRSADLEAAQKTAFSATYRDPSLPSGQRSIYFPNRQSWNSFLGTGALSNVDTSETAQGAHATGYRAMASGGVMYDDGGTIDTMWGGNANLESHNPFDGGTVEFNGPSHAQGGIGMAYNGNPVEVEGGEYASKDAEGNLNIFGNMLIPGTKTKFKKAAKAISDKEKRYDFLKTKGSALVNDSNPANKFEQLAFNAGKVMMQGGQMGQADLATKKERLASLQKSMLDMAAQHGLDPFEMSKGKMKKAKGGASIPFSRNGESIDSDGDGNDPTRADRNLNPGNIRYGTFAKKYGAKKDKDGFAIFPSREVGEKAMKDLLTGSNYKNMSVSQAIKKWTGGHPYRYDLGPLTDKPVSELNPDELDIVMSTMKQGEGTRYGMTSRPAPKVPITPLGTPNFTPYGLPDLPLATPATPVNPANPVPTYKQLDVPEDRKIPSNVEPLHMNQILGEMYAAATNKVEPVPTQRYEPQLYTPYQVSFQDRINANQSAFNAQQRAVGAGNPAALGALGAQKYAADQNVYADEFRTNQAIANDITNKNIALVNDANLKNLGIADTQMVRQSTARSKTRELNQMILNSISGKYAQNEFENKRLAAYENLYDYRFVPQEDGGLSATYFGPNAMFNYDGRNANTPNSNSPSRTITRYDAQGNLKGWAEYDDSELRDQQRMIDLEMKRRKLPLMQAPPLNSK